MFLSPGENGVIGLYVPQHVTEFLSFASIVKLCYILVCFSLQLLFSYMDFIAFLKVLITFFLFLLEIFAYKKAFFFNFQT
jgi:hypothetical protein